MLMSESGINRHHDHLVQFRQNFLKDQRRRCRVEDHADAFAQRFHALDGAVQIVVALPVNEKRIGTGGDKFVEKEFRIRNHQVRLQRQSRHPAQ